MSDQHTAVAQALHETAHQVAAHGGGHEAPHELPNFITILHNLYPESSWVDFLHVWENVVFSVIAATLISVVALIAASKKDLIPSGVQNFCEAIVEGIEGFVTGILGDQGYKHIPFLGTLFVYILLMNWSGLVPFMKSSTAAWSTTVALGLITMIYVQITGIREQGLVNYCKHLAGNPSNLFGIALIPLMLAINLTVELVAVPLSLSLRLFANVSSEDKLLFKFAELNVLFSWLPFFFQLFANILAIAFSVVQAFVFMLLSTVYISLVLPHDHGHDHEEHDEHPSEKELAHAH